MIRQMEYNGIPAVGLGTAGLKECEILNGIIHGGARHLDCARMYGNEIFVGNAIKKSKIPREAFFLTTKIFNDEHSPERAQLAVKASLAALKVDYLDLVLIHWPCSWLPGRPFVPDPNINISRDTWPALARLVHQGLIKRLGVSNFDQEQLKPLLSLSPRCQVNQIEAHPFFQNTDLIKFCQSHDIQCIAWGPLAKARSTICTDARLFAVARMLNRTHFDIALRWNLDRGVIVIPKSKNPSNIKRNLNTVHMSPLSEHDHRLILQCETGRRRFPDLVGVWPSTCHPIVRYIFKPLLSSIFNIIVFIVGHINIVAIAERQAKRREELSSHQRSSSSSS
mmetsp:Transcript_7696/g.10703  ORF Transcript_7696/g.10703 Transcript_7696/m.10703 type:complete len:337 (+) Transcript_7696:228-1238(+)